MGEDTHARHTEVKKPMLHRAGVSGPTHELYDTARSYMTTLLHYALGQRADTYIAVGLGQGAERENQKQKKCGCIHHSTTLRTAAGRQSATILFFLLFRLPLLVINCMKIADLVNAAKAK